MNYSMADVLTAAGFKTKTKHKKVKLLQHKPRPSQLRILKAALNTARYGDFSDPGCVSADTEFLTHKGWKRIDQYVEGDLVSQFNPDTKQIELVAPIAYVRKPCKTMLYIEPARGTSQALSLEHRVLSYDLQGNHRTESAASFHKNVLEGKVTHRQRKFCNTFTVVGKTGIDLSDSMIRLQVAVMADSHLYCKTKCRINVKKERKKIRLRALLKEANVGFKEATNGDDGFSQFYFIPPRMEKEFGEYYWNSNQKQLEVFASELPHWGGSIDSRPSKGGTFSAGSKQTADFAQYCFACSGKTATLSSRSRGVERGRAYATEHVVQVAAQDDKWAGPGRVGKDSPMYIGDNKEGFKYCFEVPTTYLVLRRNGRIFTTGNTGKSLTSYLYITAVGMNGRKILAIMPPGLTDQYLEKYYEAIDVDVAGISTAILGGTPANRQKLYAQWNKTGWPTLLVMGYQMFLREGGKYLRGKGYDTLIADEAHMLKTASSKTHKLFKIMAKEFKSPRVLLMTGTPMPTTPECAYGVISILSPKTYRSKAAFDRKHLIKTQMGNFRVTTGYKNLGVLSDNLYQHAQRVTKEEVLDLEKPNVVPVDVSMSVSHRKLYKKLMDERMLEFGDELIPAIQSQTLRRYLMQVASNPNVYSDTKIVENTIPRLDAILDSLGVTKYKKDQVKGNTKQLTKVLIFVWYKDTMAMLQEHLKDLNPAVIDGNHNTNKNKVKFIEDDTCRVALVQPRSGAAGLDGMQNVCHNVIFFEPVTSPGEFDQAASRLIRSGQEKVVNVYVFNVKGTVFTRAIRTMMGRAEDLKTVVVKIGDLMQELLGVL